MATTERKRTRRTTGRIDPRHYMKGLGCRYAMKRDIADLEELEREWQVYADAGERYEIRRQIQGTYGLYLISPDVPEEDSLCAQIIICRRCGQAQPWMGASDEFCSQCFYGWETN